MATWAIWQPKKNTTISEADLVAGCVQACQMFERYFHVSFTYTPGHPDPTYVIATYPGPLYNYGLAVADRDGKWYWKRPRTIYIDAGRNLAGVSQVRVLIAHELGHIFAGDEHSNDERDIMHINVRASIPNFTRSDYDRIKRYLKPRGLLPWEDPSPPWLPSTQPPPTPTPDKDKAIAQQAARIRELEGVIEAIRKLIK